MLPIRNYPKFIATNWKNSNLNASSWKFAKLECLQLKDIQTRRLPTLKCSNFNYSNWKILKLEYFHLGYIITNGKYSNLNASNWIKLNCHKWKIVLSLLPCYEKRVKLITNLVGELKISCILSIRLKVNYC